MRILVWPLKINCIVIKVNLLANASSSMKWRWELSWHFDWVRLNWRSINWVRWWWILFMNLTCIALVLKMWVCHNILSGLHNASHLTMWHIMLTLLLVHTKLWISTLLLILWLKGNLVLHIWLIVYCTNGLKSIVY